MPQTKRFLFRTQFKRPANSPRSLIARKGTFICLAANVGSEEALARRLRKRPPNWSQNALW
jgi:hypothetical protein